MAARRLHFGASSGVARGVAGLRLTTVTAGGGTERRLPGVIAAARHRSGCGTSPDARYGAAVALRYTFLSQNALSLRVSNKVVIDLFMTPTAVCGPFCGCLSVSALGADGAAEEQSQSPPHDLLKPLRDAWRTPPHTAAAVPLRHRASE